MTHLEALALFLALPVAVLLAVAQGLYIRQRWGEQSDSARLLRERWKERGKGFSGRLRAGQELSGERRRQATLTGRDKKS